MGMVDCNTSIAMPRLKNGTPCGFLRKEGSPKPIIRPIGKRSRACTQPRLNDLFGSRADTMNSIIKLVIILGLACTSSCYIHSTRYGNVEKWIGESVRLPFTMLHSMRADADLVTRCTWSREQLIERADREGIVLSLTTLGPGYRAIARSKHNQTQILGYVEGMLRPGGRVLHLDKMQVFQSMVKQARLENPSEFRGGGTIMGVGLFIGYLCFLHGKENGCTQAEFLAIDDSDKQHKRLVRFYKLAGFDVIKYVGEGFRDIPDRLVWGGCGTLMRRDIDTLLAFQTQLFENSAAATGTER